MYFPFETRSTAFCKPMGYDPKLAPNVYQLIGSALIGNFLMLPSYLKIKILVKCRVYSTLGFKGLCSQSSPITPCQSIELVYIL